MSREPVSLVLAPDPAAVRRARALVRQVSREAGLSDDVVDSAVLLTSEAVTNAVLHAGTPVDVVVQVDASMARVEIYDGDPALPVVVRAGPLAVSGRGLRMIEALAEAWGVQQSGGGKCLWFEIRP